MVPICINLNYHNLQIKQFPNNTVQIVVTMVYELQLCRTQTSLLGLQSENHYIDSRCTSRSVASHVTSLRVCGRLATGHLLFIIGTDSSYIVVLPHL